MADPRVEPLTARDADVARWDSYFARPSSPTMDAIMRRTLTSAYPPEVEALTIWPTWDLGRIAQHLHLAPGETLVDLASGAGQLGLWIARTLRVTLIGVDPSSNGRERAAAHAQRLGVDATYVEGHFLDIPLADASADALMCIDAIHFAPDVDATLREMRRVLRVGGRCVVVGAEARAEDGRRWSGAFDRTGFVVVSQAQTPDWEQRFLDAWRMVGEAEAQIRAEMGAAADAILELVPKAEETARTVRHTLVVAERAS